MGAVEASKMNPKTWELPMGDHILVLDVFHQLHCLVSEYCMLNVEFKRTDMPFKNFLRKYVNQDIYPLFENISDAKRDYYYFHRGKNYFLTCKCLVADIQKTIASSPFVNLSSAMPISHQMCLS